MRSNGIPAFFLLSQAVPRQKKTAGEPEVAGRKLACCGRGGDARAARGGSESFAFSSNAHGRKRENKSQCPADAAQRRLWQCQATVNLVAALLVLQTPLAEVLAVVADNAITVLS